MDLTHLACNDNHGMCCLLHAKHGERFLGVVSSSVDSFGQRCVTRIKLVVRCMVIRTCVHQV